MKKKRKNQKTKYDRYKRELASVVYKFFDEKSAGDNTLGGAIKS